MKLVFHVGSQKTGSSSLQSFCLNNLSNLQDAGILFPDWLITHLNQPSKPDSQKGHGSIKDYLSQEPDIILKSTLDFLIQCAMERNCDTILLSDEEFLFNLNSLNSRAVDTLKSYFDEIRFVCYFRNPYEFLWSLYKERLTWKHVSQATDMGSFLAWAKHRYFPYYAYLAPLLRAFGDDAISVFGYEQARGDIIQHFFAAIQPNLDISNWPQDNLRANHSLPDAWVEQYRSLLSKGVDAESKGAFTADFLKTIAQEPSHDAPGKAIACPPEMDQLCDLQLSAAGMARIFGCYINTRRPDACLPPAQWLQSQRWLSSAQQEALLARHRPDLLAPQSNDGSWGLSAMLNGSLEEMALFIRYHLALGPKVFLIYLDLVDSALVGQLKARFQGADNLQILALDQAFWQAQDAGDDLDSKLGVVHLKAREIFAQHGCAWGLNIDGDELLYPTTHQQVDQIFRGLSASCSAVRIWSFEALAPPPSSALSGAPSGAFASRHFKRNLARVSTLGRLTYKTNQAAKAALSRVLPGRYAQRAHRLFASSLNACQGAVLGAACALQGRKRFAQLSWFPAAWRFYAQQKGALAPLFRNGFLGHSEGRTALASTVRVDRFSSHRMQALGQHYQTCEQQDALVVLHFDAGDLASWTDKWRRRLDGRTRSIRMSPQRIAQLYVFRTYQDAGQLEQLYDALHRLSPVALKRALAMGLCIQADPLERLLAADRSAK